MVRLSVLPGQVGMRVDDRISRKMVDVSKGNTSCVVADEEHYQEIFQYGIAKHVHLPWFLPAKIFIYFRYRDMNLLRLSDIYLKYIWNTNFLYFNLHHHKKHAI